MATLPKISAPIGRVRIKTTGRNSGSGDRWRSAEPPLEAEVEELDRSDLRPRFYPFPLPSAGDAED